MFTFECVLSLSLKLAPSYDDWIDLNCVVEIIMDGNLSRYCLGFC